ncbi:MAG: hypothetical protein ACYC61_09470 [Isosphaeraceae bacterium]
MLDLPEFPSYRVEGRLQELRRLGLSPIVVRMAMFDQRLVADFGGRCGDVGPFDPEWREQQPPGSPVTYLWRDKTPWRHEEAVIGAWIRRPRKDVPGDPQAPDDGQVEFIKFRPDDPCHRFRVIAHSEQGLLAFLFGESLGDIDSTWQVLSRGGMSFSRERNEELEIKLLNLRAKRLGFRYFPETCSFWRANAHRSDYPDILADYTRSIR